MSKYVLIKRDLFENPEHLGYTGIREKAGTWGEEYVKLHDFEVRLVYSPSFYGHYALPFEAAPEFTNTCYRDLSEAHLKAKIEELRAENDRLREELEALFEKDLRRTVEDMRRAA
ncbi:hypothetical protein IB276_26380 [Ensifer sp. ENS04]|uniref:hypothetical protein n=1 Tax=Ensifer sp. ENS04 TaxID=2769281 RepID=UPI00177BE977|nr:hypothetical protein [Ensifer sp. ENS04]MBD9542977.1 hypothetical protein [Ensifer sp. ENS04]